MSINQKPKQTPNTSGGLTNPTGGSSTGSTGGSTAGQSQGQGQGSGIGGQRRGSWRGPPPNGGHGHVPHGHGHGPRGPGGGGGGGTSGMVRLGSAPNGHSGMRTDADIGGGARAHGGHNNHGGGSGRMRELQPWGTGPGGPGGPQHQPSHQQPQQPQPGGSAFPALGTQPPTPNQGRKSSGPSPSPSAPSPLAGLINAMSINQAAAGGAGAGPGSTSPAPSKSQRDAETFGDLASEYNNGSIGQWDQFATNAKLFGTKTDYDEGLYTTAIKKGHGKEWEEKIMTAERLEREIMGGKTENPHVAEERGQVVVVNGDAGEELDEEDKYSGVRRKSGQPNAYVPPALRRLTSGASSDAPAAQPDKKDGKDTQPAVPAAADKPEVKAQSGKVPGAESKPGAASPLPVLNVTGTDSEVQKKEGRTPEKLRTGGTPRGSQAIKGDIQGFVEHEKEKLQKQRETMAKAERERKLADLKKFGATFKIPGAKPSDLPVGGSQKTSPNVSSAKPVGGAPSVQPTPKPAAALPVAIAVAKPKIKMVIPEIPPFHRAPLTKPEAITIDSTADAAVPQVKVDDGNASVAGKSAEASAAVSPAAASAKLNPGASTFVFKPNPKAADFKPTGAPVDPKSPPAPPAVEIPPVVPVVTAPAAMAPARNPFFGAQVPKRNGGVNIRDDFNPFKGKVVEARNIPVNWPFAGKKFLAALHPTGAYMTAPPLGMEEDPMHMQGHPGAPMMNQFAMGPNGPFPPYRVQHQGGFPVPGSPGQPGMVNGNFAPPYGPGGGFYVPQGGPVMGGPGTPNGFPQGLPPFANNPGNQSPMMVANAMLRPAGNPVYYVQPPGMSHPASPHPYPATPQSVISNHPTGPPGQGGPGPNA